MGSPRGGARFGPLRSQGFRALYAAHVVSVVGDGLVSVALAFAVLDLTGSASDLGLVLLSRLVPMVFLYVAGGVWADRLQRYRLMVASQGLAFVAQTTSGTLLVTGHASIASLALLQGLNGVATAFYRPASSGLVPRLVDRADLQQANALLWGALAVGGVLGPAVAGIVVATAGPGWALLGDGCTFAVSALLLLRLRPYDLGTATPTSTGFWADVRAGWDEVRSRAWIRLSILYFSLFQLSYLPAIFVLGPTIAKESLGGPAAWALIVASLGIGSILGNVLALKLRIERPLAASYVVVLAAVPTLVLLATAAPAIAIAATAIVSGTAVGLANTFWETTLQQGVPPERLSRVAAYDWMGSTALRPVGLAVIGPLAAAVGTEPLLLGIGVAVVVGTLAILGVDEIRTRRSDPPAELDGEHLIAA